jgi:ditrans,polycis-polyprenyl diphosphate synthase
MKLGLEAVTVFAFSIENFKRSKEEVDYLMQLFCEAFVEICDKK